MDTYYKSHTTYTDSCIYTIQNKNTHQIQIMPSYIYFSPPTWGAHHTDYSLGYHGYRVSGYHGNGELILIMQISRIPSDIRNKETDVTHEYIKRFTHDR